MRATRLYACSLHDRTIVIGFIIGRWDASSCNGNVRRPTLCHDDSHYAALYAYYDNNNDSDDIANGEDDADPRYGNEFHYRLLSPSPEIPRLRLLHFCARTIHTYVVASPTQKERAPLRCCCCSHGIRATDSLLSFLGDIGGRQRGHRESGWTAAARHIGEREECRGSPVVLRTRF